MVLFGNDTVTLFNRHFDKDTENETWIPSVLTGVNLVISNGKSTTTSGTESDDAAKLFCDDNCCNGKEYINPKDYEILPVEEKRKYFTFQPDIDFFVSGDISSIKSLTSGFFQWVLDHYDNVFKVTNINHFDKVMEHMEVGGK